MVQQRQDGSTNSPQVLFGLCSAANHSQISNQGQNPQFSTGGEAEERDIVCSFGNAIADAGRLGAAGIGWGDVVSDQGV